MRSSHAFSLVEIAVSLAIFSFCLIGLLGLLTVGVNQSYNSRERVMASHLMTGLHADRVAAPSDSSASPLPPLNQSVDSFSDGSEVYLTKAGEPATRQTADFKLNYRVRLPSTADQGTVLEKVVTTTATLSWPAGATLENAEGFYEITFLQPLP